MQTELKPKPEQTPKVDPSAIKQQFTEMNQEAAKQQEQVQMTEEQIREQQKLKEEQLDQVLPYLRKQKEALELEMDLTRLDMLLNRINPQQVPGTFGKQLEIEVLEANLRWSQYKIDQNEMLKRAMQEKRELEEERKKNQAATIAGKAEQYILDKYKEELTAKAKELEEQKPTEDQVAAQQN